MTVFTVSSGEAASFQEQYQRLVETWIREFVERQRNELPQQEKSHIRLTDGNRVVYGQVGKEFRNEITPEIVSQLEQLEATPVGGSVKGAGAKILEVDGLVVLQCDADGKVLVNQLQEQELTAQTLRSQELARAQESGLVADLENLLGEDDLDPHSLSNKEAPQQHQAVSGTDIAESSLRELPSSSLKRLLEASLNEMRTSLQQKQQQGQALEELVRKRLGQPEQISWWQQVQGMVSGAWQLLNQTRQEYSAAAALKTLFHSQVSPDSQVYQSEKYVIERQGHSYTLLDKSGTALMQFQSTAMGVRVERSTLGLTPDHYRDIKQLSQEQEKGDHLSGAFAPVGQQESEYLKRVSAITKALVQHAVRAKRTVQVDGQFSYRWKATPDGSVRIDAKDGRGSLLVEHQGQLRCRMSNRDLAHFEQMLPVLNSVQRVGSAKVQPHQQAQIGCERN